MIDVQSQSNPTVKSGTWMRIIIASHNANKVREIKQILRDTDIQVISLDEYPDIPEAPEDHDTFEANALQKQRLYLNELEKSA